MTRIRIEMSEEQAIDLKDMMYRYPPSNITSTGLYNTLLSACIPRKGFSCKDKQTGITVERVEG